MPYDPITESSDRAARRHDKLHEALTDILASYDANDTRGTAEAIEASRKVLAEIKPYGPRLNKYGEPADY